MIWTLNIAHRNASIYIRSRNHILGVGSGRSSWSLDHQLVRGISYHTMHVLLKSLSCPIIFQLAGQECCMLVTYVVFTLVWIIRYSPMHCTKTIQRSKVHNSWTTVKYFDQHEKVSVGLQLDRSDWAFAFETFRWKMFFLYFGRVGQHLSGWLGESKVIFKDINNWFNCRVLACTSLTLATLKLNTSDTSLFLATLVPAQASAAYYRNCKWPYRLKIQ